MKPDWPVKPIIILPPDTMSAEDIQALRDNHICVVVAADPAKVKFLDPIPSAASRTAVEDAAIKLSRKILNRGVYDENTRANITKMYVDLLVRGTPLDPEPSRDEREQEIFDAEKVEELRRLAREEVKDERAAIKADRLAKAQKDMAAAKGT